MGIFIELKIVPNKINVVDWNSTYDEAKQLISSYPFLDVVVDNSYGCSWNYAVHSSERPIKYRKNNLGFRMLGDLVSMEMAESFELIKDLNYYRFDDSEKKECKDVLQLYKSDYRGHDGVVDVFHDIVNLGEVGDVVTRCSPITYRCRSIIPSLKFS